MDTKKNELPLDEHLFQQAMDGVRPLKTAATTDSKAPATQVRKRAIQSPPEMPGMDDTAGILDHPGVVSEDGSTHRKNGVQKRVLQKLKRGRFKPGDELDLHQMNRMTASAALKDFITVSRARSLQCVRIIHGKGLRSSNGPRLRSLTRELLREHPLVLAFTACKPADGGDGATDVLLKS